MPDDKVRLQDNVTLYNGDCLDVMPTLEGVDAVITDPPYGQNILKKSGKLGSYKSRSGIPGRDYKPVIGDDKPFEPSFLLDYPIVCLWGANWYSDKLPQSSCWLIWDKRRGTNSNDMADCEIAWTNLSMPSRLFHHRWMGMIKDGNRKDNKRYHPTQKPVELMKWCIELATSPGDLILDPFMGSGTTGVACVQTGRRFIGIEIDKNYFDIAEKRIKQAQQQIRMPI